MRFTMDQSVLHDAVRSAARAVGARQAVPVLSGVHLESGHGELRLRATDLEVEVRLAVPAQVTEAGAVVLPARYLQELVRRLPPGPLGVRANPANATARIEVDGSEYVIHGFAADQFPAPGAPGASAPRVTIEPQHLATVLRETGFATGHDESRPWFTGVFLSLQGDQVIALATDGAILAYSEAPVHNPGALTFSVILPGRSLQELGRLLPEAEGCRMGAGLSQFHFDLGSVSLTTRLLEGQYPDFRKYIPAAFPTQVRVSRERFQAACERAALAAHQSAIRLDAGPTGLTLTARTPEVGEVTERLLALVEGPHFSVPLNVHYVLSGLRSLEGPDLVLDFASARTAVRFRSTPEARSFFAVLPLLSF
jgi:DNA polymerase III subunit beta